MLGAMCRTMMETLGLESYPVAVKFFREEGALEGYDAAGRYRYCQALMLARRGKKLWLGASNIVCPAAAAAFGLKPLPNALISGEMLLNLGLFGTKSAAAETMARMPRLPQGEFKWVALSPMDRADFWPDVLVFEGKPEPLMWVALASIFDSGGRLTFSTGVFQATCVDSTVVPFLTGRPNATLGCYGCRDATDIQDHECLLGVPGKDIEKVGASLENLAEKAMPRARGKTAYRAMFGKAEG